MELQKISDLKNEDEVASLLAAIWKCEVRKIAEKDRVDRFCVRGGIVVSCLEVKCRDNTREEYPTVYLALRKWQVLTMTGLAFVVPAMFVVRWENCIGSVDLRDIPTSSLVYRGRKDRGHLNDEEPIVEVPIELIPPIIVNFSAT